MVAMFEVGLICGDSANLSGRQARRDRIVSEMCALRIEDIDSQRMQLRIPQGKTGQRYARLTPAVLNELRAYYRVRRP